MYPICSFWKCSFNTFIISIDLLPYPWHICLQNIGDLFIPDFQNLLCHHGPGSFQETVKLLRTELPDKLHAPYTFVRLTFAARAPLSTVALIERPSHTNVGLQWKAKQWDLTGNANYKNNANQCVWYIFDVKFTYRIIIISSKKKIFAVRQTLCWEDWQGQRLWQVFGHVWFLSKDSPTGIYVDSSSLLYKDFNIHCRIPVWSEQIPLVHMVMASTIWTCPLYPFQQLSSLTWFQSLIFVGSCLSTSSHF